MPLLQGQPFKLTKPPENIDPLTEVFVIQHTGEKFVNKSDYEDRLALYSQSIWSCQCSGKSGLTHQEAWTSEAKVRVLLQSSFPEPLMQPILSSIHHSTLPLDQLVEVAINICHSRYHPGEELTLLGPSPIQVRVLRSKEDPNASLGAENFNDVKSLETPATPVVNGCSSPHAETPMVNGTSNGTGEEASPPNNNTSMNKGKEDSPTSKKKTLLPLLYDVAVIGEDREQADVPAKLLQRTYRMPPKEHFRLMVRGSAMRHRSSSYTPWLVSEDLVRHYNLPSKLASIFTTPKATPGRKRKSDIPSEGKNKKVKAEKSKSQKKPESDGIHKVPGKPGRKPKVKRDPNAPRKKPGPKPGSKRTPKIQPSPQKSDKPVKTVKTEVSDSDDDDVSLAVLASKQVKTENGDSLIPEKPDISSNPDASTKNRKIITSSKQFPKKMKQATLFDLTATPSKKTKKGSLIKGSPRGRPPTAEAVMRSSTMKTLMLRYNKNNGDIRKVRGYIRVVVKRLSLGQLEVVPVDELRLALLRRYNNVKVREKCARLTPGDKKQFLKEKTEERLKLKLNLKRKLEDKLIEDLVPLPAPQLVSTPDEIPNSLFGDIAMVVEFLECYQDFVKTDKKWQVSHSQLTQALAAGPRGFKYVAEIICLLLHFIVKDERLANAKELGMKLNTLPVHRETATELARLCLKYGTETDEENVELNELSDTLLHKLESSELYELKSAEVLEILKALCHRVMDSDTTLEYVEEVEEKLYRLSKEERKYRKEEEERLKNEKLVKRYGKKNVPESVDQDTPKKKIGRPRKKVLTITSFLTKKEGEDSMMKEEGIKEEDIEEENIKEESIKEENIKEESIKEENIKEESIKEEDSKKQDIKEDDSKKEDIKEEDSKEEDSKKEDIKEEDSKQEDMKEEEDGNKEESEQENLRKEEDNVKQTPHTQCLATSRTKRKAKPELEEEKNKKNEELKKIIEAEKEMDQREKLEREFQRWRLRRNKLARLKALGVDRNHDRYWVFNSTTPGLFVEKGWVDARTTYNTQVPAATTANCRPQSSGQNSSSDSDEAPLASIRQQLTAGSDSDDKPLAAIKQKLFTSPQKEGPPVCHRPLTKEEEEVTFPPVGQNLWFCYKSVAELNQLLDALATKGIRESKLHAALTEVKPELEALFDKTWEPLEELEDGALMLTEALRGDILQIEKELTEGMLGTVPNMDEWITKTEQATSLQELGECLVDAQRHMNKKYLKGNMLPQKGVMIVQIDNPEECDLMDCPAVQQWRDAVTNCQTFSRMHMLVGVFDSCIKWEKSLATKKCKVCRQQGNTENPLAICETCEVSYHWCCMRPPLKEEPLEAWHCSVCKPSKISTRPDRHRRFVDDNEEDKEKEKVCRVCTKGLGLIFCCRCPAAYHSECHDPPLLTRARKDWECVDCINKGNKKGRSRGIRSCHIVVNEPDSMITETRGSSRRSSRRYDDDDDYNDKDYLENSFNKVKKSNFRGKKAILQKKNKKAPVVIKRSTRPRRVKWISQDESSSSDDEEFYITPSKLNSHLYYERSCKAQQNKNYKIDSSEEEEEQEQQGEDEKETEEEDQGEAEEEENEEQQEEEEEEEDDDDNEGNAEKGNEMEHDSGEQQDDGEVEDGDEEQEEEEDEDEMEEAEEKDEDEVEEAEEKEDEDEMEEAEEKEDEDEMEEAEEKEDEDEMEEAEEKEDEDDDMEGVEEDKEEEEEQEVVEEEEEEL